MESIRDDSIKRSCDNITEIALANDWDCMATFTLSSEKIDRYDVPVIQKKFCKWLNNIRQRKNVEYIIVPEYHKDGAVHFHGLLKLGKLELIDSGKRDPSDRTAYNILDYKLGFSVAVLIDNNKMAISRYIAKYITKDTRKIFGKFYLAGGNLKRKLPCDYDNLDYDAFEGKQYPIEHTNILVKYAYIK